MALLGFLLLAILAAGGYRMFFSMPGRSWSGEPPPPTEPQQKLAAALQRHVEVLAGQIGERHLFRPEALESAAQYIEAQFSALGLVPRAVDYELLGQRPRNIEVERTGATHPEEIVLLGAHYDSIAGSPAANDNASGVAALLELARLLGPGARTLRLVAFVNEEPPWSFSERMGSMVYARRARERGDDIVAMISLETIGCYSEREGSQQYPIALLGRLYPTRGNFIGFVGNVGSRALIRRCVGLFRAGASIPSEGIAAPDFVTGIGWSDHWSFWQVDYPALMITDTALFRYPHYHTEQDTPDQIDTGAMARVVDGLVPVVKDLLNGDRP